MAFIFLIFMLPGGNALKLFPYLGKLECLSQENVSKASLTVVGHASSLIIEKALALLVNIRAK